MANGIEDLHEKNKDAPKVSSDKYDQWRTFQGREDAEMLLEKTATWSSASSRRHERDSWDDED